MHELCSCLKAVYKIAYFERDLGKNEKNQFFDFRIEKKKFSPLERKLHFFTV